MNLGSEETVSLLPTCVALMDRQSTQFYTDKKENLVFLIYKEIQSGAVANSFMRKGFLILYMRKMRKYFPIDEKAFGHMPLQLLHYKFPYILGKFDLIV
jgi:hypothetical protein